MSTPTGKTGYPKWNPAIDIPDGAAQDDALGAHFDARIGETVATASALPSSGNWLNRTIMAVDTNVVYVCTALPGTWKRMSAVEDSGWVLVGSGGSAPAFGSGWSAVSASGWSGVRYRIKNGVLYVSGAATKTSFSGLGDAIFTLPSDARPTTRFIGVGYGSGGSQYSVVEANGVVCPVLAGSSQFNFSIVAPLA